MSVRTRTKRPGVYGEKDITDSIENQYGEIPIYFVQLPATILVLENLGTLFIFVLKFEDGHI